jgi:hypothetical protein
VSRAGACTSRSCAFTTKKATVENDFGSLDGSISTASTSYQVITFHDKLTVISSFTTGIYSGLGSQLIREWWLDFIPTKL